MAVVREETAAERYGNDETDDPRISREFTAAWTDLHAIQKAIPFPPRTAVQMLCHAEIAFHGADKTEDGKVDADFSDCFEGPAARLIEACMAYFGAMRR